MNEDTCDDCRYADWKRNRCRYLTEHPLDGYPPIPAAFRWLNSFVHPIGGEIARGEPLPRRCKFYETE